MPVVALTIDDGWNPSSVLAILAVLQRERVNATFLPYGETVVANASVWRRVAAAGFPLANHTWSHATLTALSFAGVVTEVKTATTRIAGVTGKSPLPLLRPPGGAWNASVVKAAAAAGMRALVLWDTSFGDTGRGSVAQLIANGTRRSNGSIVLMHGNGDLTPEALPAVISWYRSRGFAFVTLGQMFGLSGPVPYPLPGPTPNPTPSPTPTPSPMPTLTPSPTPTPSPMPTPTPAPTPTSTPSPTPTPLPSLSTSAPATSRAAGGSVGSGSAFRRWLLAQLGQS